MTTKGRRVRPVVGGSIAASRRRAGAPTGPLRHRSLWSEANDFGGSFRAMRDPPHRGSRISDASSTRARRGLWARDRGSTSRRGVVCRSGSSGLIGLPLCRPILQLLEPGRSLLGLARTPGTRFRSGRFATFGRSCRGRTPRQRGSERAARRSSPAVLGSASLLQLELPRPALLSRRQLGFGDEHLVL